MREALPIKMASRWRSNHYFVTIFFFFPFFFSFFFFLILLLVFQTRVWTGTLGLILNIEQCHQKARRRKTGVGSRGLFGWVLGWPDFENLARTRKDALFSCGWILARLH